MLKKLTKKVETAQRLQKKRFRNSLTSLSRCQTSPIFFSYPASLFCGSLITLYKVIESIKHNRRQRIKCPKKKLALLNNSTKPSKYNTVLYRNKDQQSLIGILMGKDLLSAIWDNLRIKYYPSNLIQGDWIVSPGRFDID